MRSRTTACIVSFMASTVPQMAGSATPRTCQPTNRSCQGNRGSAGTVAHAVNARRGGPRRIGIFVHDNVTMIDVAGPADVFHHAMMFGACYETLLISADGRPVRASNGLTLHADAAVTDAGLLDTVIVLGAYGMIRRPLDPVVLHAARELTARTSRITSVCTGAFLLAH